MSFDYGSCAYSLVQELNKKINNKSIDDIDKEIMREVKQDIENVKDLYLNNIFDALEYYNIESNLKYDYELKKLDKFLQESDSDLTLGAILEGFLPWIALFENFKMNKDDFTHLCYLNNINFDIIYDKNFDEVECIREALYKEDLPIRSIWSCEFYKTSNWDYNKIVDWINEFTDFNKLVKKYNIDCTKISDYYDIT